MELMGSFPLRPELVEGLPGSRGAGYGNRSNLGGWYPLGVGLKSAPTLGRGYCAELDHLLRNYYPGYEYR